MNFPIENFEDKLSPKIVKQGEVYWRVGSVKKMVEEDSGQYKAQVRGRELYEVELNVIEGVVFGYSCTCPHPRHFICQHITAAFFALRKLSKNKEKGAQKAPRS